MDRLQGAGKTNRCSARRLCDPRSLPDRHTTASKQSKVGWGEYNDPQHQRERHGVRSCFLNLEAITLSIDSGEHDCVINMDNYDCEQALVLFKSVQ